MTNSRSHQWSGRRLVGFPAIVSVGMLIAQPVFLPQFQQATSAEVSARGTDLKTQKAIERGLTWLVGALRRDGTIGADESLRPDLSCTAMVGLALLAEGSTPTGGRYARESEQVLYGVLELVRARRLTGTSNVTLVQTKIGRQADLFFATLYLSAVYGEAPGAEKPIREALDVLVNHISQTQQKDGTWGSESWAPILGTVMGWTSLRAASAAGIPVRASAEESGKALLKTLRERSQEEASWMHKFYKEASSLRVLYSLGHRDDPVFQESVEKLLKTVQHDPRPFRMAGGEEYLSFYLVTECLLKEPDSRWAEWSPNVQKQLIAVQNQNGSWTGHHCITDRTFCTAAALLTLLAPNRNLTTSDL